MTLRPEWPMEGPWLPRNGAALVSWASTACATPRPAPILEPVLEPSARGLGQKVAQWGEVTGTLSPRRTQQWIAGCRERMATATNAKDHQCIISARQ